MRWAPLKGFYSDNDKRFVKLTGNTRVSNEGISVSGASGKLSQALKTHRWSTQRFPWSYKIKKVPSGYYSCDLHFGDTSNFYKAGEGIFNIRALNKPWLGGLIDVISQAGGRYKAYKRTVICILTFPNNNNQFTIELSPVDRKGDPILSTITCRRTNNIKLIGRNPNPSSLTCWKGGKEPGGRIEKYEFNLNFGGPKLGLRFKADEKNIRGEQLPYQDHIPNRRSKGQKIRIVLRCKHTDGVRRKLSGAILFFRERLLWLHIALGKDVPVLLW